MKTMSELQAQLKAFALERDWETYHTPKNLTLALTGEVGELCELVQWKTNQEIIKCNEAEKKALSAELADIQMYLARLADVLEIDLMQACQEKLQHNAEKYPVDKAKGNAKKYHEF